MSQPVRQMLRPILHLRLDATAWKRGPPIIIVSIAATVPTQAAPMTVTSLFSSVSELAANHSLALSMIAGTTTIDMKYRG